MDFAVLPKKGFLVTPKVGRNMNLSRTLLALIIMWGGLLSAILLWAISPESFIITQSVLPKEETILSSSSLDSSSQTINEVPSPPSFPQDLISIQQAITSVTQRNIGRIIRAELWMGEIETVYIIDVEGCDGKITMIEVDAHTGQVLGPVSDLGHDKCSPLPLNDEAEI